MKFFRMYGFLLIFLFVNTSAATAADMGSIGSRVFKLQQNMAKRGNPLAQYKLGTFYEFGVSVKPDLEVARSWYQKAAVKKYRPAINRLKYLEIMAQGYKPEQYDDWLEAIKKEAQRGKADSLILLGQMYHRGYGVEKNLKKSLNYLQRASALGHPEIQNEIDKIEDRLQPKKKKPVKETPPVVVAKSKPVEAVVEAPAPKAKITPPGKPLKTDQAEEKHNSADHEKEEKRRRYEAAMREYYRQQLILQQQQEWSESQLAEEEDESDGDS